MEMANRAIQRKERINQLLSVLLVYALFFQEFVPFARSMNSIEFGRSTSSIPFIEMNPASDTQYENTSSHLEESDEENKSNIPKLSVVASSGPGQSESSGFSIGTTDGMVDKFTGDFAYSLPLMNVEGYPITLTYNSNVTMLQDASWVGLGWDLNVGAVSREMRGIPDEFNGEDEIVRTFNQLNSFSSGYKNGLYVGVGKKVKEHFMPSVQATFLFGKYSDNYLGFGKTVDLGLQGQFSIGNTEEGGLFLAPSLNLGFNYDSKNGIGRSQNIGVSGGYSSAEGHMAMGNVSFGNSFNSRYGTQQKSISIGASA